MSPVTRNDTGFSGGTYGASPAYTPGAPTFVENTQYRIASSNDVLVLTSDEGGPVSIDVPDGIYTPSGLATALETAMNADATLTGGAITFSVSYDSSGQTFTIDAGTDHTIALTYTGSDAASTFGFDGDKAAAQTITSDSETHGTGTITVDLDANGNGEYIEYAIYDNTSGAYVGTDGLADEASEAWQALADWDNGGQDGRVTVAGLTDFTAYTFKVKARNEDGDETVFGADSATMNTRPSVDYGLQSDELARRITGGNTRIKEDGVTDEDGETYTVYVNGTRRAIPVTIALENYDETVSRVTMEFSEDSGSTWATAHSFFEVGSSNKTLRVTSDEGGPVTVSIAEATYDTGAALATAVAAALNGNSTLTGGGTITFTASHNTTTGKYTIDAGAGHTIALDYYDSTAAYLLGFTGSATADRDITSDESRGSAPNTLATSEEGTEHTIYWDSGRDAGKSERKSTAKLRLTPYDASPSGGDAAGTESSDAFTVNNRPSTVTVQAYDSREFGKDTTPVFAAVMGEIYGGTRLFYEITIESATEVALKTSTAESVAGWEYETSPDTWVAVTPDGISTEHADGTNRVRYTVQSALDVDNDNDYSVTIRQGETRDRG